MGRGSASMSDGPYRGFVDANVPPRPLRLKLFSEIAAEVVGSRRGWSYQRRVDEMLQMFLKRSPALTRIVLIRDEMRCGQRLELWRDGELAEYTFFDNELARTPDPREAIIIKFLELEWQLFTAEEKAAINIGRAIWSAANRRPK